MQDIAALLAWEVQKMWFFNNMQQ